MTEERADHSDLVAHFRRAGSGEALDIVRPEGETFPIAAYARWCTPDDDRGVLNELLEVLSLFEVDGLATAVLDRRPFDLPELREFAQRPQWTVTTDDDRCRLVRPFDDLTGTVGREDMLLTLEVLIRTAVEPFAGLAERPEWAERAAKVHPLVINALGDANLFDSAV